MSQAYNGEKLGNPMIVAEDKSTKDTPFVISLSELMNILSGASEIGTASLCRRLEESDAHYSVSTLQSMHLINTLVSINLLIPPSGSDPNPNPFRINF